MAAPELVPPQSIAVLGAGTMGSGIAQTIAQAGFSVRLHDLSTDLVQKGLDRIRATLQGGVDRKKFSAAERDRILGRIETHTDAAGAVRDAVLVIEAVFEEERVKRELFQRIAGAVRPETLVATNTSSLSVTRLQDQFPEPGRFAGLHFFYPAAINRLVEVIGGEQTRPETLEALERFAYRLRKIPIPVRDRAGFAVNRFFVPYLNEATRLAQEKAGSLATIESVGRELFGTTLGPFELMNVTGIPIAFHSMRSLEAAFGRAYAPTALLDEQFRSGQAWPWKESAIEPERTRAIRERFEGLVFGIAARLVEEGVATAEAVDRGAVVGLRWRAGPFALMSARGLGRALGLVEAYAQGAPGPFPVSEELRRLARDPSARWPLRYVRVERDGPVAWVLLDRPEALNALNSEVLRQVDAAFESLAGDDTVRAVVLAGSSPVFAAGADIGEMALKDVPEGRAFGFFGQSVCKRIEEFRAPVIAFVEGYALGGGFELALACDFVVAAGGAQLGLPEVTIGIHPGFGGASRLSRLVGRSKAKYLVYTGRPVSAEEAYALGIIARVLPPDRARAEVRELARTIADRAPLAVQWSKSVMNRGLDMSLDEALRFEGDSAGRTFGTEDRAEGMRAFQERRKPVFQGK
jgi:enoyl-CoA hydratase/3-hydroxyacyl-CoA dehydrogenase